MRGGRDDVIRGAWIAEYPSRRNVAGSIGAGGTLPEDMTIIVGACAADGVVLVSDERAISFQNKSKADNTAKILQIGGNCLVGMADDGPATMAALNSCGFAGSQEHRTIRFPDSVANALRKHYMGKTLTARWWEEEEDRLQHLGKPWDKDPHMTVLIAGYDARPFLYTIDQAAAFAPHSVAPHWAIGITHWALPLLPFLYPKTNGKPAWGIEYATRVSVFCALITSKFSPWVGGCLTVAQILKDQGARFLAPAEVNDLELGAERMFDSWTSGFR